MPGDFLNHTQLILDSSVDLMDVAEAAARNCTLRLEHIEALNISSNWTLLQRLYNMCEHTWDPNKTWGVYYWEELIPPLIIYSLTLLLGVSGNTMILWAVLGFREMKSPTNLFLASLAFADLLLCVICLPVKLAELFSFSWTFGHFMCKFVNYMQNVLAVASVLNLTVMSLERCYAIVYPMKAKSVCTVHKAKIVLAFVWLGSYILAGPTVLVQEHREVGLVEKVFWCVPIESPMYAWQGHEVYFLMIILIIPGGIMSAAYGAIAIKICECIKERHQLLGTSLTSQKPDEEFMNVVKLRRAKTEYPIQRRSPDERDFDRIEVCSGNHNHLASATNLKRPSLSTTSSRSYKLLRQRDLELKLSLRLANGDIKSNPENDDNSDKANPQHFCVFEKEFLRLHEQAWIPINYGTRVQKESLKKFRKAIRMLCVIIIVFVLCWTPYLTFNILQSFGVVHTQLRGFTKHLKTALTLMAYLNSALNPIIYGFMCKSFRENFSRTVARSRHWRSKSEVPLRDDRRVRRRNTEPWRTNPNHEKSNVDQAFDNIKESVVPAASVDHQKRKQFPRQWVSSCGCVHNTYTGDDFKNSINPDGLCGCICGEGHIHLTQKCGNECQLICCNAHGLRVNRSRARKKSLFQSKHMFNGSITL